MKKKKFDHRFPPKVGDIVESNLALFRGMQYRVRELRLPAGVVKAEALSSPIRRCSFLTVSHLVLVERSEA